MSSSVSGTQSLLDRCAIALRWAGIEFRADKSRSFVMIKGKSLNCTPFYVSKSPVPTDFSDYIPSIHSAPVKFLGRIIDGSISDRKSIDELEQKTFRRTQGHQQNHALKDHKSYGSSNIF